MVCMIKYDEVISKCDGLKLDIAYIVPEGEVLGVIQLSHGMAEHKERYFDFMKFLAGNGFACVINDHRGHGKSIKNNNDLVGVCEVKGYQVRVVFVRIDKDTYGLITALVKKQDNDSNYRNFLKKRISEYRKVCPSLKKYISDEKIMAENSDNLAELYNILGVTKENGVEKKKGGKND